MPTYYARKISDVAEQAVIEVAASHYGRDHAHHPMIETLRKLVPFDQFAISGLGYSGLGLGHGICLASDAPEGFLRAYTVEAMYRFDPLPQMTSPASPWAHWQDVAKDDLTKPEVQPLVDQLAAYGVKRRSFVAFYKCDRAFGGATFTRDRPFDANELFILEMVARKVHADLSDALLHRMSAHLALSSGEVQCVRAVASGLSPEACTEATGYTPATVATYIKSATKKLGANNRTHAVAEAFRSRILD